MRKAKFDGAQEEAPQERRPTVLSPRVRDEGMPWMHRRCGGFRATGSTLHLAISGGRPRGSAALPEEGCQSNG